MTINYNGLRTVIIVKSDFGACGDIALVRATCAKNHSEQLDSNFVLGRLNNRGQSFA
jgi:hypothetical protein